MATIVFQPEGLRVPTDIGDLERFRAWARSPEFPERGRIDWIGGEIEIDLAAEELNTHGAPKAAIARALHELVVDGDLGTVYVDATRVSVPAADLSCEPDVVVVFESSVVSGRVRLVPKARRGRGLFIEIEGPPDVVVEVVSDSSQRKDAERLRERYHRAGVEEYWLVDARRIPAGFSLLRHEPGGYTPAVADADGFLESGKLGVRVRLVPRTRPSGVVVYRLEVR